MTPANTRGGPTCNYDVLISNSAIPIGAADRGPGEHSFRSTLSSGDRNTLALAFFFSSIEHDPQLADRTLVVDDPITSLDEHRSLATAQELRRLGNRVSQIIILSHDKGFLAKLWVGIDHTQCSTIKLERDGDGSNIVDWDLNENSLTEHDRNHSVLRLYLETGARDDNERREVARALRPVLEAFLRVAFPEHFRPGPGAMRQFRYTCHQRLDTGAEIMRAQDVRELEDLAEYANRFHHNTNPAWEHAAVNDGELGGFVRRVLRFASK